MRQRLFEQYYEQYSDAIYKYIFLLVGHKETAEDLTQETFYRGFKHYAKFQEQAQIQTWLRKIARNIVYDYYRRKRIIRFIPFVAQYEPPDMSPIPSEIVEKGEKIASLYKALSQLKLEYREALILRKMEGLSIKETAQILGWSEAKVKNNTARAIQALKKIVGKEVMLDDEGFRAFTK
ncbi:RNA polymerase sigma factor [Viridibacillus sp. YIM B01967]|uniref:RNA polymerase sigma factor n=1 Tax=Viridibacillus soli TaxID=2798301 RepID=A0ABS1HAI6_9BACL|nr:RNA polymerase sigma factor [Viridibacillus soli]MBK3496445.1 RNA polymerase sigma factor [Viridibacillus soli]